MSMEFNSNFNDFIDSCRKKYDKAMKDFQNSFDQISKILSPLNDSNYSKENYEQFSSLISRLNQSCSELKTYSLLNNDIYYKIIPLLNSINDIYTSHIMINPSGKVDYTYTISLLNQIAQIPSFFSFNLNEISKIYKNNVGNAIKSSVDKEIMENRRVRIAYITAIIGLVTGIIGLILKFI